MMMIRMKLYLLSFVLILFGTTLMCSAQTTHAPATTQGQPPSTTANEKRVITDRAELDPGVQIGGRSKLDQIIKSHRLSFFPGFIASISMIIVSEIGDKTFFIAAIMAMRHSRVTVFLSALSALILMTILSAVMGITLPNLLPREYVHSASIVLFLVFGVRLLHEAYHMKDGEPNEELDEVETELDKKELEASSPEQLESGTSHNTKVKSPYFSPIFIQCFTMTFLAEWGDRSQITTIALAAAKDPFGVTLGGMIGHAICTGVAVIGGKLLATRISERTVAWIGGILFLIFAVHGFYTGE